MAKRVCDVLLVRGEEVPATSTRTVIVPPVEPGGKPQRVQLDVSEKGTRELDRLAAERDRKIAAAWQAERDLVARIEAKRAELAPNKPKKPKAEAATDLLADGEGYSAALQ